MRVIFGVLSLLIVLAVVGTLVKKQLTGVAPISVDAQDASQAGNPASAPAGNARQQSQQIQQQVKQSIEAAMQQARPVPEDK
jgi:Na+-transporting methylmalonyl-CoA/oxaloacetate decarboxylase gamma subunit